tara:strand:- start:241 stop:465 length:225 start_codon:yes stop_codon:yes gene_type:complete
MTLKVTTRGKFSKEVERTVTELKISYMDAVVHLCEKKGIEIESANLLLTQVIKENIELEAQELNFLPKPPKLPI